MASIKKRKRKKESSSSKSNLLQRVSHCKKELINFSNEDPATKMKVQIIKRFISSEHCTYIYIPFPFSETKQNNIYCRKLNFIALLQDSNIC